MHQSSRGRRPQCTRVPSHSYPTARSAACRTASPCCGRRPPHGANATRPHRCRPRRHRRAAAALGGLLITGAVVAVCAVTWKPWNSHPGSGSRASVVSAVPSEERTAAVVSSTMLVAARLQAGMEVEYHGRRWTVVRVSRVTTRPGILLELREAGMPGFHILYVDPSALVTVISQV